MADPKTRGRSADRKRLNKSEPYEVAYAKSDRASPARKAMLAKAETARSGRSAQGTGKAKGTAASRSASAKRPSGSAAKKSVSPAKKAPSRATRGARSASPSMQRTNVQPSRSRTPTKRGTPHPPKAAKTVENTAPKTMREADAVDLLTDDHLEVGALFKKYDKLARKDAPAADRRALAETIFAMLKVHTRIEEEIFYPTARSAGIDADQLDEAKVEHGSAKELIAQLEAANPDDDLYDARMTVLGEYIQHHVVEEHTELFPQCRRARMDLVALRAELEARKISLQPAADDAARARTESPAGESSPGLLTKLGDKLFSSAD
jgi:hemerythrin-like domain-containing protein|nr:hemerythrin domain-containing protein [Caldimonas sp.]